MPSLSHSGIGYQPLDLGHGALKIIVNDADRTQTTTLGQFALSHCDPSLSLLGRISPAPQTLGLDLGRRRFEKDEEGIRRLFKHLGCALDINLENHIAIIARFGPGTAVEVSEEVCVLKKTAGRDLLLKRFPVYIGISAFRFTWALHAGRPTT